MKKFLLGLAAISMISFSMTSCSDDSPSGSEGEGPSGGSGSMETMTPEESKQYLEDTATEALNMVNPEDQREVVELLAYFTENYGDYDLPDNFFMEEDDNYLTDFYTGMYRSVKSGDAAGITRAVIDYTYDINFNLFKGIYEPGEYYQWEKVADSNDVVFCFTNGAGQACELKATGSSNSYTNSFEWTEEDYYWDETYHYNYSITVPAEVNVTLKAGSTELISAKVESNISLQGHSFNVNADVTVANINVVAQTNGNDSNITENSTVKINGNLWLSTSAKINGSHLCDLNYYAANFDDEDEAENALASMLNSGEASANILNKIQAYGNIKFSRELIEALDGWVDSDSEAQQYVNLLNNNISANLKYNNTATEQASVKWTYMKENYYGDYYDYYIMPVLLFPDGTTYEFEDYFDTGFGSVESLLNSLIRKYQSIWYAGLY